MTRNLAWLQENLAEKGYYKDKIDNLWGINTRNAILSALTDGPDYTLTKEDVSNAAKRLGVEEAIIWTVWDVEASGRPFIDGRPTILFEPHRFSRSTKRKYDKTHPNISSPVWNKKLYPGSQKGRYEQLLQAVRLDVDAGFMSASYGGFQILGENYEVCGAITPWAFAWQSAQTEADQLEHFLNFVEGRNLVRWLKQKNWAKFAEGYNGTGYKLNQYDIKLADRYAARSKL